MESATSMVTPNAGDLNDNSEGLGHHPWELTTWLLDAGAEIPGQLWFVIGDELADGGVARRDLRIVFMQRKKDSVLDISPRKDSADETRKGRHTIVLSWGIDYDEIRTWLSLCDTNHPQCQLQGQATFPGLLVIDCKELRVIPAPYGCKYIALSYVWGPSKGPNQTSNHGMLETDLRRFDIPRTVQDSMTVTLKMGLRYLWVDRYCIDQANASLKHDLIANMDSIYQNAHLTIIAAAGADADAGIPGVSYIGRRMEVDSTFNPSKAKPRASSSGIPIFSHTMRLRPVSEVELSVWSARGWTYQEALLSRRCLIFTETHTAFQCLTDTYRENLGSKDSRSASMSRVFGKISTGYQIFGTINEYAVRELSFPADSLNAFLGILRLYGNLQDEPIMHIWGLPLFRPIDDADKPQSAQLTLESKHLWAKSLLWQSPQSGLRRVDNLPSWSWAGWRGWAYDGVTDGGQPIARWRKPVGPYNTPDAPDPGEGHEFLEILAPKEDLIDFETEIKWSGRMLSLVDYYHARLAAPEVTEDPEPILHFTGRTTEIDPRDNTLAVQPESLRQYQNGYLTALVISWGAEWRPASCLLLGRKGQSLHSRLGTITFSFKQLVSRRWKDALVWEKAKIVKTGPGELRIGSTVFTRCSIAVE